MQPTRSVIIPNHTYNNIFCSQMKPLAWLEGEKFLGNVMYCIVLLPPPRKFTYIRSLVPVLQNMTIFRHRVFKEVIKWK